MMLMHNKVRLLLCLTLTNLCATAEGSIEVFLLASRAWLPDRPVIMSREAIGEAVGLTYAGYDPKTGAWFMAGSTIGGGRDPSGRSYLFRVGQKEEMITPVYEALPYHIGTLLPVGILASMHERPDIITEATERDDSWYVTYRVTMDQTKSPPVTKLFVAQFDVSSGRMLSHERSDAPDRQRIEFDLSNPDLERAPDSVGGPQHKVKLELEVAPASFTQSAIRARMKAAEIAVQQKSVAIQSGYTEDSEGDLTPPSGGSVVVPYTGRAIGKYRLPLIVVGALIVAIAGFEIYRRRSA
jgi:hypothetical protein